MAEQRGGSRRMGVRPWAARALAVRTRRRWWEQLEGDGSSLGAPKAFACQARTQAVRRGQHARRCRRLPSRGRTAAPRWACTALPVRRRTRAPPCRACRSGAPPRLPACPSRRAAQAAWGAGAAARARLRCLARLAVASPAPAGATQAWAAAKRGRVGARAPRRAPGQVPLACTQVGLRACRLQRLGRSHRRGSSSRACSWGAGSAQLLPQMLAAAGWASPGAGLLWTLPRAPKAAAVQVRVGALQLQGPLRRAAAAGCGHAQRAAVAGLVHTPRAAAAGQGRAQRAATAGWGHTQRALRLLSPRRAPSSSTPPPPPPPPPAAAAAAAAAAMVVVAVMAALPNTRTSTSTSTSIHQANVDS